MDSKGYNMKRKISIAVKETKMILFSLLWTSICLTLLNCPASIAAEFSTFAGGEFDGHGQGFSYLGVDLTQNINKTIAVSGRVVPNYLTYQYYSGDNIIRANSPGLSTVAGIKLFWDKTMLGIWGGVEFRNTTLSPDDPSARTRGSTTAGTIQGEFDTWFPGRTNFNVSASYSGTSDFVYEKARIKKQITNLDFQQGPFTLAAGVEQFFGQNSDFHGEGAALLLELYYIPLKFSIALRGGMKHDTTFGNGVYGGLDLYKGF